MPTLELVSIGCPEIPELPRYESFAWRAETELVSHRGIFQPVFHMLSGVIVHLANKDLEDGEGGWYAGALIDWGREGELVAFLSPARADVEDLMRRLIEASPLREITFSTDAQGFGEIGRERGTLTFGEFLGLLDGGSILFNELWRVRGIAG
ncbi:hypothetical protein [Luteolibacter sp. LG18]|uniref:hypothetical protein n=1 Tax=Luteolibacter sp. LG18 TaxID=2819286 RepID=UPI002B2DC004|nr:hypothetical protein llg_30140 [Luteolibacter sp. LG18]